MAYQPRNDGILLPGVGVIVYCGATGALAEYDDARWVTAKGGDVVADPFDDSAVVVQGRVLGEGWGA